ncbi:hypothetical protein CathTA2_0323 [Caldalkalibacillus thermarum TA2.A1]|uniref:Uncharacterized protein n=1 Tax=Caldalkalibacillus thermarum (strain TA2.A1) TaxID=986075 RepID=F5L3G2_CALTT|nr:hypothetical protein CathTA2_0323 [Caldalkalibacillus thermarum TA2.A1]GGK12228.1 hypothetical protein GCM10010965_01520 [Caldalkalibacillus thermarum]
MRLCWHRSQRGFWGEGELSQFQERVLSKIRLIDRKVESKKSRKKERKK